MAGTLFSNDKRRVAGRYLRHRDRGELTGHMLLLSSHDDKPGFHRPHSARCGRFGHQIGNLQSRIGRDAGGERCCWAEPPHAPLTPDVSGLEAESQVEGVKLSRRLGF